MTEYVVLIENQGAWSATGRVKARSSQAAIRLYINGSTDMSGEYVAIPVRSWKPVTVKVETKTELRFS